MNERATQPGSDAIAPGGAPVVRTRGLLAEYSVGRCPSGEWFAVGTVREENTPGSHPAWLIVGTGASQEAAVANLADRLEREAERVSAA